MLSRTVPRNRCTVLPHIGDLLAQRSARDVGDVLPVDGDRAAGGLVKAQQQVEHRGLAAARRSDQRRHLAGLGHERHAAQHRLAHAIEEAHVGELHARRRELQRRLVVVRRLGRGLIDHLEQHPHADQMVVEFEIEPRQALCRLVGEQERSEERDEVARRRALIDDQIAAVDDRERRSRGRRASPSAGLRGWRRAPTCRLRVRTSVTLTSKPLTHLVLERERLDDAHALQRLLHRLDGARAAGELPSSRWCARGAPSCAERSSPAARSRVRTRDITGSWITITAKRPSSVNAVTADRCDQQR